ncbi:hypothetical protein B0H13DRAFT_1907186 [Mycena leptocephala]|nr:hypothetical protein B0H13DRAFT_1907186 [Mycena leptocephala]
MTSFDYAPTWRSSSDLAFVSMQRIYIFGPVLLKAPRNLLLPSFHDYGALNARLAELINQAPALQYLFLSDPPDVLARLPPFPSLETLRLNRSHFHSHHVKSIRTAAVPCIPNLTQLILHTTLPTSLLASVSAAGAHLRVLEFAFAPQVVFSSNQMQRPVSCCPALEELSSYLGAPEISALVAFTYPALRRGQFEPNLEENILHDPTKSLVRREAGRGLMLGMMARGCRVVYDNGSSLQAVTISPPNHSASQSPCFLPGFTSCRFSPFGSQGFSSYYSFPVYVVLPRQEVRLPSQTLHEQLGTVPHNETYRTHAYTDFSKTIAEDAASYLVQGGAAFTAPAPILAANRQKYESRDGPLDGLNGPRSSLLRETADPYVPFLSGSIVPLRVTLHVIPNRLVASPVADSAITAVGRSVEFGSGKDFPASPQQDSNCKMASTWSDNKYHGEPHVNHMVKLGVPTGSRRGYGDIRISKSQPYRVEEWKLDGGYTGL